MRIIEFDDSDHPIMSVQHWATELAEQNDRLRNRIAINRLCRAMYREARSKQNMRFASVNTFGNEGTAAPCMVIRQIGASAWRAGSWWR